MKSTIDPQKLYRAIPSVQQLLQNSTFKKFPIRDYFLKQLIREETEKVRTQLSRKPLPDINRIPSHLVENIKQRLERLFSPSVRRIINATGIILHTNLGRAPLAMAAKDMLLEATENYNNLEINLDSGDRGERIQHVEELLCLLTGAEAAFVVNNNAAAVLLCLNSLANRKEVPVSRGELVEIGGSYRMPDVMKASGVKMVEIGTTNKTHLRDYEKAVNPKTASILKVHTSNYRIKGFVSEVSLAEIVQLARKNDLPVIFDMGSGALVNLSRYGVKDEPLAGDVIKTGVDIVSFSGDKLLGGPQSGVIIGKKKFVDKIRRNHLARALRCGKLTFAALEGTLRLHLNPETLPDKLPTISMLSHSMKMLKKNGELIIERTKSRHLQMEIKKTTSQMGSGTLPLIEIPSMALALKSEKYSSQNLAAKLRGNNPPIIGYVREDFCFLNLRTISENELSLVVKALNSIN